MRPEFTHHCEPGRQAEGSQSGPFSIQIVPASTMRYHAYLQWVRTASRNISRTAVSKRLETCSRRVLFLQESFQSIQCPVAEHGGNNTALWGSIRCFVKDVLLHVSGSQPLLGEPPYPLQEKPASIFGFLSLTTLSRICICSPCYQPWALTASMLADTPLPRGFSAALASVGTLSKGSRTVRCLAALPCRLRVMGRAV